MTDDFLCDVSITVDDRCIFKLLCNCLMLPDELEHLRKLFYQSVATLYTTAGMESERGALPLDSRLLAFRVPSRARMTSRLSLTGTCGRLTLYSYQIVQTKEGQSQNPNN